MRRRGARLPPESASGQANALEWKTYSVQRSSKAPLLSFIVEALEKRGCHVVYASDPSQAPFYVVFETPSGDRHGVLAYAFFANTKVTGGRPQDEHRFQIKYGGELKGILDIAVDPHQLITTIALGIDPERGVFVAIDPLMNTPAPMSRSVEFKSFHVEHILDDGWAAWERDRRTAKTKNRPAYELDEDTRTELLVGGRQERLLDLILLERIARGLDPGERHLVADKLKEMPPASAGILEPHALLDELEVEPSALFDLIQGASRLKMAVRGWVAETKLEAVLADIAGVTECTRIEEEGKPDISLRWKGSKPLLVECKNALRETYADGRPKVDFQRTRASKGDPCSRYYRASDFPILAVCLHSVTEEWEFRFAATSELPPHKTCAGRIRNMVPIAEPVFTADPQIVFYKCSHA
jgi:hypothetical protein